MKKIIESNYKSIVKRGLITPSTTFHEFIEKLYEEVVELQYNTSKENFKEELADVILVCLNISKHYDVDIKKELINKIKINEKRTK